MRCQRIILIKLFYLIVSLALGNLEGATKLSQPLLIGGGVNSAKFVGKDSPYVVFESKTSQGSPYELFRVDYENGGVVNLSGILPPLASVSDFIFSPDNHWVVFPLIYLNDFHDELYSVSIEGGPVVKLNGPLVPGGTVGGWWISPDSKRVVYTADQQINDVLEIFSSRIEGGDNFRVNPPLAVWGNAYAPQITPDSQAVVYLADQEQDQVFEIFRAPILGGNSIKISGLMVTPNSDALEDFLVSPNGQSVVYRADQEVENKYELFSSTIAGFNNVKLNPPLVAGGQVNGLLISPLSDRVVYRADQEVDGKDEIWSVPLPGGLSKRINGPLVPGGDAYLPNITSDGKFVVYFADQTKDGVYELYRSRLSGTDNIKLSPALGGNSFVAFDFVMASNYVVYRIWQQNKFELYRSSVSEGTGVKLNQSLPVGGQVQWAFPSQDGEIVSYVANTNGDGVNDLFRAVPGGNPIKLNNTLVKGGSFDKFAPILDINPARTHLIYGVDQEIDEKAELYVTPLVPPVITSPTNIILLQGESLYYQTTARYGPILGYGANQLPAGGVVQSNLIFWTAYQTGWVSFVVWATNDAGLGQAVVKVEVKPKEAFPQGNETNGLGEESLKAPFDVLFQKRKKVSGMKLTSDGAEVKTIINLQKKERVRGAGWISDKQYGLIVQSNEWVKAILVDSNGSYIGQRSLTQLSQKAFKVRASGDVNQDGLIDIAVSQKNKIGLLLSPGYEQKLLKEVGSSARAKAVMGLLDLKLDNKAYPVFILNQKKKMLTLDWLSLGISQFSALPKNYRVKAMHSEGDFKTNRFIFTKRRKLLIHTWQNFYPGKSFISYQGLGKIVGPK